MREFGILLLFVFLVALPLYYAHAWLKKKLNPEQKLSKLFLFLLINFGLAAFVIITFGFLIIKFFFPELRVPPANHE